MTDFHKHKLLDLGFVIRLWSLAYMLVVIIIISTQSEVGEVSLSVVDCQGNFHVCLFETRCQDLAQAVLEHIIILPQLQEFMSYMYLVLIPTKQ